MNPGDQSIFDAANDQHERIMNQSKTPLTDKAIENDNGETMPILALCKQLETELADANKRADEWERMAEELAVRITDQSSNPLNEHLKHQAIAKFDQMKGKP